MKDKTPYIVGLERFFDQNDEEQIRDYQKELGAACAAIGAVALYHIDSVTPEAVEHGRGLLAGDYKTHSVTETELAELISTYPVLWNDPESPPQKALIGCPHLSLRELHEWTNRLISSLRRHSREKIAVDTILVAPPLILKLFQETAQETYEALRNTGARLSATCCEAYMVNKHSASEAVLTNSNKLRAYTNARLILDAQLADTIVTGELPSQQQRAQPSEPAKVSKPEYADNPKTSKTSFQGRPVFRGEVKAHALVTHEGFNTLANLYGSVLSNSRVAVSGDHNSNLYGKTLTETALCIPTALGSTSAGSIWEAVARKKIAPSALLFAERIDSLTAAGLAIAEVVAGNGICAVDELGREFLNTVEEGDLIHVSECGLVTITSKIGATN